jgi:predicted nucleotidyltransferase
VFAIKEISGNVMSLFQELEKRRDEIISLGEEFGAGNIRVFGSVAREEEGPDSDIDILVAMKPNSSIFKRIGFQQELEKLLDRKVDVLTYRGLQPYIKDRILNEARPI